MKKVFEISFLIILTIVLLTPGATSKNISNEQQLNSSLSMGVDTTNLVRQIDVGLFRLPIIPPSSGVQFYKDGIVFLSTSKDESKMSPNQISFGAVEAYFAPVEDSILGKHMIFSPLSSFSYPCEAMTFSRNYDTVYFTMFPKNGRKEKIFMAKFIEKSKSLTGLIPEIVPLDFCTDNSNYSHPTLSSDGSMLIFASDREGSIGGMDLFISRRDGEKWSAPENLGKNINTTGNEFFPFLDSENNLFFSSDKLPGYGGYDIFTCKFNGSGWDKPTNLSDRINSDKDDIAFTINKIDGKTAFFTRRQTSGKGGLQLFRVMLKQELPDRNLLTLSYVFNGKPVSKTSFMAAITKTEVKPDEVEPAKTKPETKAVKKEGVNVHATAAKVKKIPEKANLSKPAPGGKPADNKNVTIKSSIPTPDEQKDVVIYRIQFLASIKPKSEKEFILNGKSYKLYEYFYRGAYRYTIGEFKTLPAAVELQRICRQSGYPQAFIAAFKNNTRFLDAK
jgi:WD40-like Beta Propeller Repeat.